MIGGVAYGETVAKALGIPHVMGVAQGISRARYFPGVKTIKVKLLAEPESRRLIGAQMVGQEGIKERADFLAMAVKTGITIEDLAYMENVYSPPIGALNEPIALRGPEPPRQPAMKFVRWLRSNSEHYLLMAAQREVAARYGRPCARPKEGVKAWFFLTVFAADLPAAAMAPAVVRPPLDAGQPSPGVDTASAPATGPGSVIPSLHFINQKEECRCPRPCKRRLPQDGEVLFDTDEKVFEDIQANPGEKAFVFIHTVPYEGSVALVNLLTSTRLVRKGFDVTIVLYGPGVLLASGTRGYPSVGQEAFPGHLAINNQIKTLIKEGATIHACRFAMGALYGFREDDLIPGVKPFHPLDVLDSALTAWRAGAFQINTWTV